MTPAKWVAIQELPVFSTLDYIILTEHQLSAEFRPEEIIKSGWDFHAVSGTLHAISNIFLFCLFLSFKLIPSLTWHHTQPKIANVHFET